MPNKYDMNNLNDRDELGCETDPFGVYKNVLDVFIEPRNFFAVKNITTCFFFLFFMYVN